MENILDDTPAEDQPNNVQTIKQINKGTIHRICSGQVIISLAIAVKELVENAIDAGATNIDIRLKEYGSELIEIVDNGSGVREENFEALTLKHYTSKLADYDDLEKVSTFGFRGECLSSLCALADLSIITRHSSAAYATRLLYDHNGIIKEKIPSARPVGTTVVLANLFAPLPVRKKEFLKNLKREYSKMNEMLTAYCLVSTGIKFTCSNQNGVGDKKVVLSTQGSNTIKQNIVCVFDVKQLTSLVELEAIPPSKAIAEEYGIQTPADEPTSFEFECLISSALHGSGRSSNNRQFFYINGRPCDLTKVAKIVNEIYRSYNTNQYPFVYLNIKTKDTVVDVNVTPDKRQIFFEKEKLLLATLKTSLQNAFKEFPSTYKMQNLNLSTASPKTDEEDLNNSTRGLKRFMSDAHRKENKIATSKRHKSDSGLKVSSNKNRKREQNLMPKFLQTISDTAKDDSNENKMLDMFIEEANKLIADTTSHDLNNDLEDNKEDSVLNVVEKITCKLTTKPKVTKNISSILEESGVETVEMSQSEDYNEFAKYRKRINLSVSLDSIQQSLDKNKKHLDGLDIQVKYRSDIDPKNNAAAEKELQKHITKDMFVKMEILGQFNVAFVVVKLNEDLFIIDQHASDEKYNFEQLQQSTVLESQTMVTPQSLNLTAANEEILFDYEKVFNKNGFFFLLDKDAQPGKRVKLTRIPMSKDYTFGKEDVDEMIFLLQEDDSASNILRPSRIRSMFASRACRKSVMIGKTLNHPDMRKLVDHMGEIEEPWNCPHGRPTMRHLVHLPMISK